MVVPSSLALLRRSSPTRATRARAIALRGVSGSVGSAAGPVAGGLLTVIDWRMIFFVNLPVGAVALALLKRARASPRRSVPFDWTGQVAAVAALSGLTYAAIGAGADGFGTARVLVALAVAVVAGVGYVIAQARGRHPMTPLPLLRSRTMSLSVAIELPNIGFYGMIFLLGLYLQQVHGLSALATGVAFLPMAGAHLVHQSGGRPPVDAVRCTDAVITGQLRHGRGPAGHGGRARWSAVWRSVVLMMPVGAGGAMAVTALVALLLDSVPAQRSASLVVCLNAALSSTAPWQSPPSGALVADRAGFVDGLHTSLLIAADGGVTVLATLSLRPAPRT